MEARSNRLFKIGLRFRFCCSENMDGNVKGLRVPKSKGKRMLRERKEGERAKEWKHKLKRKKEMEENGAGCTARRW